MEIIVEFNTINCDTEYSKTSHVEAKNLTNNQIIYDYI